MILRMNYFSETLVVIIIVCKIKLIYSQSEDSEVWSLNKLLPKDYNKHIIPSINGSQILITIGIEIFDLVSVVESGQV